MSTAGSPRLDREPHTSARTEEQARAEATERERSRRLEQHGAAFCRQILDGAFEPIFQNGKQIARRDMSGNLFDMMGRPIPAPFSVAAE